MSVGFNQDKPLCNPQEALGWGAPASTWEALKGGPARTAVCGPVSVAQKPERGGGMETQEAMWGGPHGSSVFADSAGARGQSMGAPGGWQSALPGTWLGLSWVLTLHW